MFDQVPFLLDQLKSPDYLHLVLQPLLVQGLLLCAIFTLICLVLRQKLALGAALLLTAICAGAAFPYLTIRSEAVQSIQLSQPQHLGSEIEGIMDAFSKIAWIYYAISGLAFLAAATLPMKNKLSTVLSLLVVVSAIYGAGLAATFHHRESRIFHPNLVSPGESQDLDDTLPPSDVPPPSPSATPASQAPLQPIPPTPVVPATPAAQR